MDYFVGFDDFAVGGVEDVAVTIAADRTLVEGHDVLRECARLVGKDVLDLAQLLVQGSGPGLGRRLGLLVEHLLVPVDQEGLGQPDDFDADVERDGHDRVQHDGVREEDEQCNDSRTSGRRLGRNERIPWQIRAEILAGDHFPNSARDRAEEAHRQEKENDLNGSTTDGH